HIYLQKQYATPKFEDIVDAIEFERNDIEQVFDSILGNTLIRLNQEVVFHVKSYEDAKAELIDHINKNGNITLSQFRDILGTSRKYAVALLEYFDNEKVTKRIGEERVLYRQI
ncbi:MAG TPA: SelB C-terminal domain-containing protein, partial [Oscillospiraceae bacterium]|nr:SelB C-terminal domain-containing protein [Oscillospiraceae bacterium]